MLGSMSRPSKIPRQRYVVEAKGYVVKEKVGSNSMSRQRYVVKTKVKVKVHVNTKVKLKI